MSDDRRTHAAHGSAGHASGHGDGDHGAGDESIGPIDLDAWGASLLGIAAGLLVAVLLALAAYR